jgi:hypothetical protein
MTFVTLSVSSYALIRVINSESLSTSTFTSWDSYQEKLASRSIANSDEISCEFNEFNLSSLKKDIRRLEANYETGHELEGNLFGLNLKALPFIQAQFLADNKQFLGDQTKSLNNTNCSDALCLMTKVYSGSEVNAHLSYYWYLKTGNVLSMSNNVPGQNSSKNGVYNEKEYSINDYLFTTEELKNFYILSKSLPIHFLHTPLLKSIHKVPGNSIENSTSCSKTTNTGAILVTSRCLSSSSHEFLLKMSAQIANYVDIDKGQSQKISSISGSNNWKDSSLWIERSFFDLKKKKYHHSWKSFLPKKNFISQNAMKSPSAQLSEILAAYRYDNKRYAQQTPIDIQKNISSQFFDNKRYDDLGLYNQFIKQAMVQWSKEELSIWDDCLNNYLPENSEFTARDLASKLDSPLFSCVEKKIPHFVNNLVTSIRTKKYEGCKFFNNEVEYSHLSQKFYSTIDKYLQEKVLKRKIELQNHGDEVLEAQKLKDQFIVNVDPVKVYISCFSEDDQESCFNQKISYEASKILIKNRLKFSKYYYSIVSRDLNSLFDFDLNKRQAHALSKRYLAPFYSKVSFAATSVWNSCKEESFSPNHKIKLPMTFTGGKHFVNAKLLNCVNDSIDDKLFEIVDFKAKKIINKEEISFELSHSEKVFAKSFMKKRLVQIFTSLLEQEVSSEKKIHAKYFVEKEQSIVKSFLEDKKFFNKVYSFKQVTEKCVNRVATFYPKSYFTISKSDLNQQHGKKLCQTILSHEKVSSKINDQIQKQWSLNKNIAKGYLNEFFTEYSNECKADYPIEKGRGSLRNKRLRLKCIQESFEMALYEALDEWRDEDLYKHFSDKEKLLGRELASLESMSIAKELR